MSCDNTLNDFYRGDTVPILIKIKINGVEEDITGSTLTITMKKKKSDADPGVLQKEAVILNQVTNTGEALFTLGPSDTDIDAREYYYDIQWENASSAIRTIISGTITVLQDITTS